MTFKEYWKGKAGLVEEVLQGFLGGRIPQWVGQRSPEPPNWGTTRASALSTYGKKEGPELLEESTTGGSQSGDLPGWVFSLPTDEKPFFRAPRLQEAMAYSLLAPGKRLRPVLVLAAAEVSRQEAAPEVRPNHLQPALDPAEPGRYGQASGNIVVGSPALKTRAAKTGNRAGSAPLVADDAPYEPTLLAACAVEMIHTYSLIHDDLPAMDNDDLRRGRPTCHRVYGEAMAILAGDALLTLAFEILGHYGQASGLLAVRGLQIVREIARAAGALGMAGGQVLDLEAEGRKVDLVQLKQLQAAKTGALFIASLRAGAILVGASPQVLACLSEYGRHLGLAFQITDDLLDVTGDGKKTGKGVGRDAAHDKSTFPSLLGVEGSRSIARSEVEAAQEALAPLGEAGWFLRELAAFLLEREI